MRAQPEGRGPLTCLHHRLPGRHLLNEVGQISGEPIWVLNHWQVPHILVVDDSSALTSVCDVIGGGRQHDAVVRSLNDQHRNCQFSEYVVGVDQSVAECGPDFGAGEQVGGDEGLELFRIERMCAADSYELSNGQFGLFRVGGGGPLG